MTAETNNKEVGEANAVDSAAGDDSSTSPAANDITSVGNSGSSSVAHEDTTEGADEKKDDSLLSNSHDPFNENDKASSAVEEATSDIVVNAADDEKKKLPPQINEDLIKELNIALDSCEQMRRVNLEVEYSSASPSLPPSMAVNHDKCTYCQREAWQQFMLKPAPTDNGHDKNNLNNGGGGITIGKLKLDGSRIKNLDGSRIRRLRSNVGSFFAAKPGDNQDDGAVRKEDDDLFAKVVDTAPKEDSITGGSNHSSSFEGESGNNINSSKTTASRKKFLQKSHPACLTCGHPVCGKHRSSTLSTSNIRICQPCAYLFELDFLVDVITTTASNEAECRKKVDEMVYFYDRAKLLLLFTSQYTDQIAEALEHSTVRSNKIGVGSSATGMVSGMAGVVGCGALLFPPVAAVGIPLLISSLVFGGAATAAQTGDAAVQYFSEPNKLADKMVTLHGMMLSLLRVSEVLSCGLLKEHADLDGDADDRRKALAGEINELLEKHGVTTTKGVKGLRTAVVGGAVAAEAAAAGAEISATSIVSTGATVAGRSSRFFGRVGTTAASSARFIPIAGGLLSAACVVVEGKELKKTVSKINEGNPCAKAEQIRSIRDEMDRFPDSSVIADECRRVFEIAEKECAFF